MIFNPAYPCTWKSVGGNIFTTFEDRTSTGRSQEFATGDKKGGLGTEVPQRGPGAEPRWGLGAKPPEAGDTCWKNT